MIFFKISLLITQLQRCLYNSPISGSQNTNIRAYKPQLLVWLRFNNNKKNKKNIYIFFVTDQSRN